jgi:hypothetical protein
MIDGGSGGFHLGFRKSFGLEKSLSKISMFESIRRSRLQREGLSCGRVRRKHQEGDWVDVMRCHRGVTVLLLVGFVVWVVLLMH